MKDVIKVSNLIKSYNNKRVLDDLSFHLLAGEALGVLGSNGAGKTTLLETIEGLRSIDSGSVWLLGKDIKKDHKSVQENIGIQLQKNSLFGELSVKQNIRLYANLYNKSDSIDALIHDFDLIEQKNTEVKNLSGGQFQRLNLCIAMINNPAILFLDEPTTGLDPKARIILWEKIRQLKAKGTSIVLTTHYMEEAQALCDRIIVLHKGKFIANDSPSNLIKKLNMPKVVIVELSEAPDEEMFEGYSTEIHNNTVHFRSNYPEKDLAQILNLIDKNNAEILNIKIQEASLEDVYLEMTNTQLESNVLEQAAY
jgi:ABC-2 type transport system ATP-binding protein